jgi:Fic family protein
MTDFIDVTGTPYYLAVEASAAAGQRLSALADRIDLLRRNGTLSDETLRGYYGEKRFEQIAESNALEGSTLSARETELAVLRGITVTGHDPAFSRDAQALAQALDRLTDLARCKEPTTLADLKELHELIAGSLPGAGVFRSAEVRIRGSKHTPPKTWRDVMDGMEQWEGWSKANGVAPPMLRAAVLHAWLTYIHPFVDGNGRTARAISNLELIRAGYPPVIIRRKDRDRYLDSLGDADQGQLGPLLELLSQRADDALRDLERAATKSQGYDPLEERRRRRFESRLPVWNAGIHLLVELLRARLQERLDPVQGSVEVKEFDELTVDDFIELSEGSAVGHSWAFRLTCAIPSGRKVTWLCWAGFLNYGLKGALDRTGVDTERPALMWSVPTGSYPPWRHATPEEAPGGEQMTIVRDKWVLWLGDQTTEMTVSDLADRLADRAVQGLVPSSQL